MGRRGLRSCVRVCRCVIFVIFMIYFVVYWVQMWALVDARSKLGNKERLGWTRRSGRNETKTILGDAGVALEWWSGSGRI